MRVRRVGVDQATGDTAHYVRHHGKDYIVLLHDEPQGQGITVTILDEQAGLPLYEGQGPILGDHGASRLSAEGSLQWAEEMICACENGDPPDQP